MPGIQEPGGTNAGTIAGVALLMSLVLLAFAAQLPAMLVAGALLCAGYALAQSSSTRATIDDLLIVVLVAALFLPALLKPYRGSFSAVFYLFSTWATFFAARAITRHSPQVLLAGIRVVYLASIVVTAVTLYVYWGNPEPLGMLIEGSSTNAIPSYLIVIQIGLSLCHFLVRKELPVLSPIMTGAVAFFGNGRASLVVAGLIILFSVLFNLKLTGSISRRRQRFYWLLFASGAVSLAWNFEELFDLLISYTKLSVGLVDTNRLEILEQYVDKIGLWTLIVGADYSGTVIEYEYSGNPHIAYIRTHALFGLPLTVLAMISPVFLIFARKALAAKLVFFTLVSLGVLRAAAEPIFFPTLLDFFYFMYFFLFFRYAPAAAGRRVPALTSHAPPEQPFVPRTS